MKLTPHKTDGNKKSVLITKRPKTYKKTKLQVGNQYKSNRKGQTPLPQLNATSYRQA